MHCLGQSFDSHGQRRSGVRSLRSACSTTTAVEILEDIACMTSCPCQNPSLTYMALTARAAHYAVAEIRRRNI
jgi:hypothetical protein